MASMISSSSSSWPSQISTNTATLRDVSFSSYLNTSEEAYVTSLVQYSSSSNLNNNNKKKKASNSDGEIDIFGAEKYFNQGIDQLKNYRQVHQQCNYNFKDDDDDDDAYAQRQTRMVKTPSCQSESSWNSQSGLLKRVQRAPSLRRAPTKAAQGRKKPFLLLPCYYCCDANSINNVTHDQKFHNTSDNNFVFPVPETIISTVNEGRKSLEVFGTNCTELKSLSLERRLKMLSWDEDENYENNDEVVINCGASDASSDLFELDCLSCTANSNPNLIGSGSGSGLACYAPSEASIEWSVVTASAAADFSAISDTESTSMTSAAARPPPPRKSKPRAASLLLGCKSQKAVRVVHTAVPANRKLVNNNSHHRDQKNLKKKYSEDDQFVPVSMSRFQAEAKHMGGYGSQKQKQDHVLRSPRWSHSSVASDLLYVHTS